MGNVFRVKLGNFIWIVYEYSVIIGLYRGFYVIVVFKYVIFYVKIRNFF